MLDILNILEQESNNINIDNNLVSLPENYNLVEDTIKFLAECSYNNTIFNESCNILLESEDKKESKLSKFFKGLGIAIRKFIGKIKEWFGKVFTSKCSEYKKIKEIIDGKIKPNEYELKNKLKDKEISVIKKDVIKNLEIISNFNILDGYKYPASLNNSVDIKRFISGIGNRDDLDKFFASNEPFELGKPTKMQNEIKKEFEKTIGKNLSSLLSKIGKSEASKKAALGNIDDALNEGLILSDDDFEEISIEKALENIYLFNTSINKIESNLKSINDKCTKELDDFSKKVISAGEKDININSDLDDIEKITIDSFSMFWSQCSKSFYSYSAKSVSLLNIVYNEIAKECRHIYNLYIKNKDSEGL